MQSGGQLKAPSRSWPQLNGHSRKRVAQIFSIVFSYIGAEPADLKERRDPRVLLTA